MADVDLHAGIIAAGAAEAAPQRLGPAARIKWTSLAYARRFGPAAEWVLLGILSGYFALKGLIVGWRSLNTDFPNYYLVAKLFRQGYPLDRVYDWIWIQRQRAHAGLDQPLVGYVPLTLFSALLITPLVGLAPLEAKRVWLVLNIVLLAGTVGLLRGLTALPVRRIALILFLTVVPLRTNFQYGQQHLLVLFLLTLAAWLHARDREVLCGATLAFTAALKIYPALFILYFIRKRLWRALAATIAAGGVLLAAGTAFFGLEAMRVYAVEILPRTMHAECNNPYTVTFESATALLRRLLVAEPMLNPHPLVHWPALFAVLQPLVQVTVLMSGLWLLTPRRVDRDRETLEWAGFTALLLALSVGSATYHFCVLVLPSVVAIDYLLKAGRPRAALLLAAMHLTICLPIAQFFPREPEGWRIFLGFPRLYALAAYWIFTFLMIRERTWVPTFRERARRLAGFGLLFATLFALSVLANRRHLEHQFDDYPLRVATGDPAFVTSSPSIGGDQIYFSRMNPDGYVVARTGAGQTFEASRGTDLFDPAVDQPRRQGWLEVASRPTSRIARFQLDASTVPVETLPVDADDGQQPVVSADGRHLGFLREEQGRARLFQIDRSVAGSLAGPWGPAHPIAGALDDVLEFGFLPDDRVVLSTFRDRRARLFLGDANGGRFDEIPISSRPVRFPAISPDGAWLAYSEEQGGVWHLSLAKVGTWEHHRVAEGDCNTTQPVWHADSRTVVYASDCGRGLGHTALCQKTIVP